MRRPRRVTILHDDAADARGDPSRDVSATVAAVALALAGQGWEPRAVPLGAAPGRALARLAGDRPDLVFNLCEGIGGDARQEANVASWLELAGLPFTGNSSWTLAACLRKDVTKAILSAHGIPTPRWAVAGDRGGFHPPHPPAPAAPGEAPLGGWLRRARRPKPGGAAISVPLIVKPVREDASLHITQASVVRDRRGLAARVREILAAARQPALVEDYVEGREFSVAVVGGEALPVSEIDFSRLPAGYERIVTWRAKWAEGSAEDRGTVPVCPAKLPRRVAARLQAPALHACEALDVRGYARVDLRMDARGRPWVIEVNPNPDVSPTAGLARAARAAGWSYADLVGRITALALEGVEACPARS